MTTTDLMRHPTAPREGNFSRRFCELLLRQNEICAPDLAAHSPAALLLKYGSEFASVRPSPWQGAPKACYANAQYLVKRRKGWTYVEGYAAHLVPLEHAWCLDGDGNVVDPTWRHETTSPDYFGIAFDMELVRRIRKLPGGRSYSVLHTWWKWREIYPQLAEWLEGGSCKLTKDVTR